MHIGLFSVQVCLNPYELTIILLTDGSAVNNGGDFCTIHTNTY